MPIDSALKDYEAFGQLIRNRRRAKGLSQEALAAEALGNPDRKSLISAIENNRLSKITSNTAKKLSKPLDLAREDIPASLRWPSPNGPAPTEQRLSALEARHAQRPAELESRAITHFLNAKMAEILRKSMSELYRQRLARGLALLQVWTGRPFSFQSLLVCYALSLIYVVATGLVSFLQGEISIGAVRLFKVHESTSSELALFLPYLGIPLLVLAFALCWYLVHPFGLRALSRRETTVRLGALALVAGIGCGVVEYLGTRSLTAAVVFTVPSCAALSTMQPTRAALYGAAGGIIFGLMAAISSGLSDDTLIAFLTSLSEGFIVGGIVGSCAGLASSLIACRLAHFRPGQLAAAGGGVGVGSLVSLAGIVVASDSAAISAGTLGFFSISWFALPLANAGLDYLSLGVSHRLGRYIASSETRTRTILLVSMTDLVLAVALMVITVVMIGLALSAVTVGLGIETLSNAFIQSSASDPWGTGIWLTIMVLSTTTWTWLHFGFVVAPLTAGALTRWALERPATKRLAAARQDNDFDVSVGVLVSLRVIVFYICWGSLALLPAFALFFFPEIMELVLRSGWRLTELIM